MFNLKRVSLIGVILGLFILFGVVQTVAQTAMVTNNFVYYPMDDDSNLTDNWQCILSTTTIKNLDSTDLGNRSFVYSSNTSTYVANIPYNGYGEWSYDPNVNSALMEYDQAFPTVKPSFSTNAKAYYPNHCLSLCAEVSCTNPVRRMESTNSSGTGTTTVTISSTDFPIQQILFDIFKFQSGANIYSADTTPPIRTIAVYPYEGSGINNTCYGVPTCCDAPKNAPWSTDVYNPSCNDYPEFTKSCCDVCDWGTAHCQVTPDSCSGFDNDKTSCQNNSSYCTWHDAGYTCTTGGTSTCAAQYASTGQCDSDYCDLVSGGGGTCEDNWYGSCSSSWTKEQCQSTDCCKWVPNTYSPDPDDGTCENDDSWYPSGTCSPDCEHRAETACKADPECNWTPGTTTTCEPKPNACNNIYQGTGSCNNTFCTKTPVSSSCSTNSLSQSGCKDITVQETCDNNQFCNWNPGQDPVCTSDYLNVSSGTAQGNPTYWQNVWTQLTSLWNQIWSGESGANNYGVSTENTCVKYDVSNPMHPCYNAIQNFSSKEECQAGLTSLHFCTPWDGSYEIDGEFGKTNGQFGFRTTIKTNVPSDGVSATGNINIENFIAYPSEPQRAIKIDVTNVHSVRSSPTLVGQHPALTAAPYKIRYRLSKDATTTIDIIDPEVNKNGPIPATGAYIHRHLVYGQPRDGEGFQGGAQTDSVIVNEDSWDGRDDQGRLLPYGNYMVSIQASTRDEWSGPVEKDLSRAVTRQLSLDPLKITDIAVTGLSKESTAYAKIDYMLTEAATVHLEIYTPGTTFEDLNICNGESTAYGGTCTNGYVTNANGLQGAPVVANQQGSTNPTGLRVASYVEQKARRVGVNSKWDGMCWDEINCGSSVTLSGQNATTWSGYAYGGALPDGDYVYLLWAEIPYGSTSGQPDGTFDPANNIVTVNNVEWDGVKTHMIYNGILPINRGFPEITIDAVSYSTIGSSPIANGLDPFVISYSLSRDSYVDAGIYTMASSGTYSAGDCEIGHDDPNHQKECAPYKVKTISENEVKEALTKNTYYWDGLDDYGRYVSAGNYMLRITAKDSLFPTKMVTRTIQFPVDMFRIVDVQTTPLEEAFSSGTLSGLASISYMLSKSMNVSVKIYDKGVIIPKMNCAGGWPPVEGNLNCDIHDPNSSTPPTPIKEFYGVRQGEGYTTTEYWDGYKVDAQLNMPIQMMPDGQYPYIIIASAPVPGAQYYSTDTADGIVYPLYGPWHPINNGMYASDRTTGYITISRREVYFTDIQIKPTHPTQYYSSETVLLAPYEIQFGVNRASTITVQIVSTEVGACMGPTSSPGTICRVLTRTGGLSNTNIYDAWTNYTLYWDGKDSNGDYVETSFYQVQFIADPYLGNGVQDPNVTTTVETRGLDVNNFQVFDRYIWDVVGQNKNQGKFAYQISVPMKTAIQILKPETRLADKTTGELINPIIGSGPVYATDTRDVLVKAIVGVRPNLVSLEEIWDGTDYAGQQVPDGTYPFRYVTVLNSYQMNSITGDPILNYSSQPVSRVVKDWAKYTEFGTIIVANGDSWYADIDWKDPKVTMFYPNPMKNDVGFFEVTKVPAPGTLSIKIYNIAGDLVRDRDYKCVNAVGVTASLEDINATYGGLSPDWGRGGYSNPTTTGVDSTLLGSNALGRNSALRCEWDRKNNAGHKVARGLYYAIMTLKPTRGNAKNSQRVIKILIP